jgi:SAM-dependent methyltransferase
MTYTEPLRGVPFENCTFYHTMDLPGHGVVQGTWDLRRNIDLYLGRVDYSGKRVLDVGTATGFLSFQIEQRGAEVVSFDADDASRISFVPFRGQPYTEDHARWLVDTNAYLQRWRNGYWYAHEKLGSRAKVFYGDVYALPAELGSFDVVVLGQILVHLRDPLRALESVTRLCRDSLVISEGMVQREEPIQLFLPRAAHGGPEYAWWHLSTGLYREILSILGFEIKHLHRDKYLCHSPGYPTELEITTITARRVPSAAI